MRTARFRSILVAISLLTGLLALPAPSPAQHEPVRDNMLRTVSLVVAYDADVEKHWKSIPWKPAMTIADAMAHAKALPGPRALRYETKGDAERTFLTSIDGLANEGAGKESRNWLFRVNDKPGQASFAVTTLEPGDTILWSFATYEWAKPAP